MSPDPPKTSTRDEVMSFLDSLENPPTASTVTSPPPTTALPDTQSVLDFLDEIGSVANSGNASLHVPRTMPSPKVPSTPNPTPIITPSITAAPSPIPGKADVGEPHTTVDGEPHSVHENGPMVSPTTSNFAPATDLPDKAWSWGNLFAAGVSAIKTSEEVIKKGSEAALKGVVAERDKMKGYVNKDALGKIGDDLRKLGTSVVNTIAPPIDLSHTHPRLVCYVEADPKRDWPAECVFRMFHASMEECPSEARQKLGAVDVDVESVSGSGLPPNEVRGLDESAEKAKIRVENLISTHSPPSAEPVSPTLHRLFAALQPYTFCTRESSEHSAFCVCMADPARGLYFFNFSQGMPVDLMKGMDEDERRNFEIEAVEGSLKCVWREWIWKSTSI